MWIMSTDEYDKAPIISDPCKEASERLSEVALSQDLFHPYVDQILDAIEECTWIWIERIGCFQYVKDSSCYFPNPLWIWDCL